MNTEDLFIMSHLVYHKLRQNSKGLKLWRFGSYTEMGLAAAQSTVSIGGALNSLHCLIYMYILESTVY